MLTNRDLDLIDKRLTKRFEISLKPLKDDVSSLKKDMQFVKTEITVIGSLTKTRDENTILQAREIAREEIRTDLDKRLKQLENIHPNHRHVSV